MPQLRSDTLYLAPAHRLSRAAPTRDSSASAFVSDPAHPVSDPYDAAYGAHDFRALAGRADVLTFDTAPLARDVEVIGAMRAEVYLQADAPDVDVYVKVLDVAPDGTAFNLMSPGLEVARASYRDPAKGRQLLQPGRVYSLTLTDLYTANRFLAGHRLRVQVMGSFQPHFSLNLQTGESERTASAMRAAHIVIRHDRAHPSRLVLPVAP